MTTKKYRELRWTTEMIERFWDWQSQYPDQYFTFNFGEEIARSLKRFLSGRHKVLDFGCGVGYLLPHLSVNAETIYGCDTSEDTVERANARMMGIPSFKGAHLTADLRKQGIRFDAVLVVEVIEHLYDDGLNAIMAEIDGMLEPDGIVIFTTPNEENREASMILCPTTGEVFHRWQHVRSWSASSLDQWIRSQGFLPVEVFPTNFGRRRPRGVTDLLKQTLLRALGGSSGNPHLVGVAKRKAA